MNNFTFVNPVKLIFGEGTIAKLAGEIPAGAKVMITYGGGSIFKNGVHAQIMGALKGFEVIEFGGIEPNPDYDTLIKAIALGKEENVNFLLAVGGGSVLDGTKFIAAGMKFPEDPWNFMADPSMIKDAVPYGTVLTLPATGSEMNSGAVISRRSTAEKFAFNSPLVFPRFSILDPTTVYSLPKKQVANGIVDTYEHTFEQYLTHDMNSPLMDRWAEGIFHTLKLISENVMSDTPDYQAYANFMLTATMGLNGFIALGTPQDWATHMIGHELTALHGLDHGVTLAIVRPGLMRVMRNAKHDKLVQYAERIWNAEGTDEQKIEMAIRKTEEFYRLLGIKTRLGEHGIGKETIDTIVKRMEDRGWKLGEKGEVTPDKVREILEDRL